jgi:hypothetical protein
MSIRAAGIVSPKKSERRCPRRYPCASPINREPFATDYGAADFGIVNTISATGAFCSRCAEIVFTVARNRVHVPPKSVFTLLRNTHT